MRNETADLAKGMAILLMIQVHLTEVFAKPEIYSGLFGLISLFLGGSPVAPLFLAILGYFLAKSRRTFRQVIVRGVAILMLGFFLNLGLNFHLLIKIYNKVLILDPWRFIFGTDILFLAGFSIISIAILRLIVKKNVFAYLFVCVVILLLTPHINASLPAYSDFRYILAFIGGPYQWSYFPLFPWLAYPLLGFAFFLVQHQFVNFLSEKEQLIVLLLAGFIMMLTINYGVSISTNLILYYHHGVFFFLWNVSFLIFWLLLLNRLEMDLGRYSLFSYIKWLGRNVTLAYVFQWLIIGNVGTVIFKTFELSQLIISYILIVLSVTICIYLSGQIKQQFFRIRD